MKIKKYNAPTMTEAMEQIKIELGNDAVILNSKVVYSGGILGFFKKRSIEVLAAIDPQHGSGQVPVRKEKARKAIAHQPNEPINKESIVANTPKVFQNDEVLKELSELKSIVRKINLSKEDSVIHDEIKRIVEILKNQEISLDLINDVTAFLMEKMDEKERSYTELISITKTFLHSSLTTEAVGLFQKKYINVVGPTGVGKTTTLAKLAAENVLKFHKKVAFITTDTYRIAAIDQLKTYAKILNVPIEVAYNTEDFKKACDRFSHYDLVFIDTAGRNFRNKEYVEELRKIISFDKDMETFLVLSLTSKQRDMEDIFQQFSVIPISNFIFTKSDETSSYGAMFNMTTKFQVPIAYLTNGQNVPDDIVKASPHTIVESILGDN